MNMIKSMTNQCLDAYYTGAFDALKMIHKALEQNLTAYEALDSVLNSFKSVKAERDAK